MLVDAPGNAPVRPMNDYILMVALPELVPLLAREYVVIEIVKCLEVMLFELSRFQSPPWLRGS